MALCWISPIRKPPPSDWKNWYSSVPAYFSNAMSNCAIAKKDIIASWKKFSHWHHISFRHQIGASVRYDGIHVDLFDEESSAVNNGGQSSGGNDFRQILGRRSSASESMNTLGPGGMAEVLNLGANDDIN